LIYAPLFGSIKISALCKLEFYIVQVLVVIVKFDRKSNKSQKRGKINLIGRLQLSTERSREEDNEGIVQLRILRVQVS
jgi:hypothetical protein